MRHSLSRRLRGVVAAAALLASFAVHAASVPVWQNVTPASPPPYAQQSSMTFDSQRQRAVLFDPATGSLRSWNGSAWMAHILFQLNVSPRMAPITYDARRDRIVLFGGITSTSQRKSDTFEWNGVAPDWTHISSIFYPMARNGHALAYAANRQRTVMTGGLYCQFSPLTECSDTWEYDGTNWYPMLAQGAGYTPARWQHAMAYDAARGVVVLFGGASYDYASRYDDTWEYDGNAWTQKTSANGLKPSARYAHAMAYDATRQKVVLYGGSGVSGDELLWEWDGTSWTKVAQDLDNSPRARQTHAMTYDSARQRLVLVGDHSGAAGADEVWELGYQTVYTVTPSVGSGAGSVSPAAPVQVAAGAQLGLMFTPDPGNVLDSVDGTCNGTRIDNTYTTHPVNADCTVVAHFAAATYTVTPSAGANGSISPSTPQALAYGARAIFTVTPDAGYTATVGGTCGGVLSGTLYMTDAIVADCTVEASFARNTYPVTPSAGANGTISPATAQTVAHGDTATFTLTPDTGYSASVGGTCGGSLVGNVYTTNPVTAACTVTASFTRNTYTVTPSAGANGTISPSAPQTVAHGDTATFTLTPDVGYSASVGGTCGGSLVGNVYTTNPITAACAVTASFVRNTYAVTPSAGANGTISPSAPQTVAHGDTATFTLTPDVGYSASVGGTCGGSLVGNVYTTNPITAACTVTASFTRNTYTVTPSAGANGAISPSTPQTVAHGDTATFTLTPDTGYNASVGGTCGGSLVGNVYTTNPVTAACTVTASFVRNTYAVTPSVGANGTISPSAPQTVAHGDTATFTLTPDVGYSASVGGTCGGSLVGNVYTTNPITAACTVTASFVRNTYAVTPSAGANGTISPSAPQTVAHGDTATFTLTPDVGYSASVGGTCGGSLVGNVYTTAPITAACTVTATFTRDTYAVTPSAGANGTISPSAPQTVAHGDTATFTLAPDVGYSASVGGTCGGSLSGNTYTTNPITAACTVTASFTRNTYTVTPSAGANGTISPNSPQTVSHGSTTSFTVTPANGYSASVGGTCGGTLVGTTYTTHAITADCTVAATFTLNTYMVTPSGGANGTISPSTPQTLWHGSSATFTVTPAAGYTASVGGTCGGTLVGTTYTTNPVTEACTVTATFTLNSYTVTPSAGVNGTISPASAQTVAHGGTATFTLTPDAGYHARVDGSCGGALTGTTYTTAPVMADCEVVAGFERNRATQLLLAGGAEQSALVGQPFAQPLAVRATDVDGVPVPGTVVTFSVASGGAGAVLSSTTATTDRDGIAAVTASANGVSGRYVVTARADGIEMPVRFSLSNLPAAVANAAPVPTLGEAMRALLAMLLVATAVLAMPRR